MKQSCPASRLREFHKTAAQSGMRGPDVLAIAGCTLYAAVRPLYRLSTRTATRRASLACRCPQRSILVSRPAASGSWEITRRGILSGASFRVHPVAQGFHIAERVRVIQLRIHGTIERYRMFAICSYLFSSASSRLLAISPVACLSNRISSASNSARVNTRLSVSSLMIACRASAKMRRLASLAGVHAIAVHHTAPARDVKSLHNSGLSGDSIQRMVQPTVTADGEKAPSFEVRPTARHGAVSGTDAVPPSDRRFSQP
jgi:hypothetical protein